MVLQAVAHMFDLKIHVIKSHSDFVEITNVEALTTATLSR